MRVKYVGLPCLVDADCFTQCRKPALQSLQPKVALKERVQLPKSTNHRFEVDG